MVHKEDKRQTLPDDAQRERHGRRKTQHGDQSEYGRSTVSCDQPLSAEQSSREEADHAHVTKELMEEVEKIRQENKDLSDRLLRTLAEFDNYRKRVTKEKEDLIAYGTEKLASALLPVLDNFERACEQAHTAQDVRQVIEGVEMILKQFRETLEKFHIKSFHAAGEPFDPEKHEAIAQQEHDTYPPNTVTAEVQKGYVLGDKLLRPARVIVAKEPTVSTPE
ncbi:MAG: nucleotide exchange factor GrpE [Desulfobacterota bacterium]|nr:nucleotide exchange factor GrpE [Thermodesulfobacteriota bacterium]